MSGQYFSSIDTTLNIAQRLLAWIRRPRNCREGTSRTSTSTKPDEIRKKENLEQLPLIQKKSRLIILFKIYARAGLRAKF